MDNTIEAHGLVKRFGATTALDGVDLAARTGTVLAVLGPNGAGKTTAVRILATLLQPDQGRALVGGYDVVAQARQVRRLIALTGQYAAVDESLTGVENLLMIGRLLGQSRAAARQRAAELLEQFSLADAGGRADGPLPGPACAGDQQPVGRTRRPSEPGTRARVCLVPHESDHQKLAPRASGSSPRAPARLSVPAGRRARRSWTVTATS